MSLKNLTLLMILVLKATFDAFDVDRKGFISTDMIGTIMDLLGTQLIGEELEVRLLITLNQPASITTISGHY